MQNILINLIHILFVAPLLYLLGSDNFPQDYKKYIVYLAVVIAIYHSYLAYTKLTY